MYNPIDELQWETMPSFARVIIEPEYRRVHNLEQAVAFIHHWLTVLDYHTCPVKRDCIKAIVYTMYSYITRRSYESKTFETL